MIFSNFITKVCSRQAFCSDEIFCEKIVGPLAQNWQRKMRDTVTKQILSRKELRQKKTDKNVIQEKKSNVISMRARVAMNVSHTITDSFCLFPHRNSLYNFHKESK